MLFIHICYQVSFETENVCIFEQISPSLTFRQKHVKMSRHLWVISHHSFQPVHVVGHPESKQISIWTNVFSPCVNPWLIWPAATISPGDDSKQCFSSSYSDWRIFLARPPMAKYSEKNKQITAKHYFCWLANHRPPRVTLTAVHPTGQVTCNKKKIMKYKKWMKSSPAR